MAADCLQGYLETLQELGRPLPESEARTLPTIRDIMPRYYARATQDGMSRRLAGTIHIAAPEDIPAPRSASIGALAAHFLPSLAPIGRPPTEAVAARQSRALLAQGAVQKSSTKGRGFPL